MTDHLLDEELGGNLPRAAATPTETPPAAKPASFLDKIRDLFGRKDRIVCSAQEDFLKRKTRCERDRDSPIEDCDNEFKMCSFEIDHGPEIVNVHHM